MSKNVAVFCATSAIIAKPLNEIAYTLGANLSKKNRSVICGGTNTGLMKSLIDGINSENGQVTGVIVKDEESPHPNLTHIKYCVEVTERKRYFLETSDVFIALPGGIGTFDELIHIINMMRAGVHNNKILILNIDGFYQPLLNQLEMMVQCGFLKDKYLRKIIIESTMSNLLDHF